MNLAGIVMDNEWCPAFHNTLSTGHDLLAEIISAGLAAWGVAYIPKHSFLVSSNLSEHPLT